jgi:adenylate cyclase
MSAARIWRRPLDWLLSIGAYQGEPEVHSSGRRVLIVGMVLATLLTLPTGFGEVSEGATRAGVGNLILTGLVPIVLALIQIFPRRLALIVNVFFALAFAGQVAETSMFGGLVPSALVAVFGMLFVLGALLTTGVRAATWWFGAFLVSLVWAVQTPRWFHPIYRRTDVASEAAFNLASLGVVVFITLVYFVRQRDRFQRLSDELLHNMLPDEIVTRLKGGASMIADDIAEVSVLFADVAGFTPMSAGMLPADLVGLLDDVFSVCDEFVKEFGVEKIKTIGDEYMVAAGVPHARADHAHVLAELALRIRDHFAANEVFGRRLSFRIGINSGPVTAGIIGRGKFSYDLWGATVNTASRMESSGIPGQIQIGPATYRLIRHDFVCEERGMRSVKGLGEMTTYLLMSRRQKVPAAMP